MLQVETSYILMGLTRTKVIWFGSFMVGNQMSFSIFVRIGLLMKMVCSGTRTKTTKIIKQLDEQPNVVFFKAINMIVPAKSINVQDEKTSLLAGKPLFLQYLQYMIILEPAWARKLNAKIRVRILSSQLVGIFPKSPCNLFTDSGLQSMLNKKTAMPMVMAKMPMRVFLRMLLSLSLIRSCDKTRMKRKIAQASTCKASAKKDMQIDQPSISVKIMGSSQKSRNIIPKANVLS